MSLKSALLQLFSTLMLFLANLSKGVMWASAITWHPSVVHRKLFTFKFSSLKQLVQIKPIFLICIRELRHPFKMAASIKNTDFNNDHYCFIVSQNELKFKIQIRWPPVLCIHIYMLFLLIYLFAEIQSYSYVFYKY